MLSLSFAFSARLSVTDWYTGSVLKKIVRWFEEFFSAVSEVSGDNLNLGSAGESRIRSFVIAAFFGVLIATFIIFANKRLEGGFIKKLLKSGCNTPENAKTLRELGYFSSVSLRKALVGGMPLRKTVWLAGEESEPSTKEPTDEKSASTEKISLKLLQKKPDFETARFYIPEELRIHAEVKYENDGSGALPTLLVFAGALIVGFLLFQYLPDLLAILDRLLSIF